MTARHVLFAAVWLAMALGWPLGASAQAIFSDGGLALRGYDPVAYFVDGRARPGEPEWTAEWDGAEWRFSSADNRDAFVAAPEDYAPQYGGFCAWAVSQGYTAPTNPHAWAIVDGRLYLNVTRRVQRRWERDAQAHIARADANWPDLRD
ncbi:MAG: YHS domain [Rhodobacteraceae bacterium HLUCCA12]|nr:MAG: YHS domain [Rhodobacteraceae bacterium HLUCCA12]